MRERLKRMRDSIHSGECHENLEIDDCIDELNARYVNIDDSPLSEIRRESLFFQEICQRQRAIINPDEQIVFTRTIGPIPPARVGNICADWELVLHDGLDGRIRIAEQSLVNYADNSMQMEFLQCAIDSLRTLVSLIERHASLAESHGKAMLARLLSRVAHCPPKGFHEALQLHNFVRESIWLAGHNHVGFGRFDQYMMPFLQEDLDSGQLDLSEAEDLLTEFFIACNRNTRFYFGVQQGDNGQSMMLGGMKPDGTCGINALTFMCLRVSEKLNMIDPKINLRIDSGTDIELLKLAARLTRRGLGFPQYSNDDIVVPALSAHGYDLEDARNYTVAACWEFIIPGKGLEIPNIDTVSFPHAVDTAIRKALRAGEDFDAIKSYVQENIAEQVNTLVSDFQDFRFRRAPLYSAFLTDCLELALEAEDAAKYKNCGIHGTASANAADALTAVKKMVFDEKLVSATDFLFALDSNWRNFESLRETIVSDEARVGNNEPLPNQMMSFLFDSFAAACEHWTDNGRGGIVRPGTGSAMFYTILADKNRHPCAVDATADGRHKGDFFSSSLAPSPHTTSRGPLSILKSYSNIDYKRVYNGGPITMELADSVFRDNKSLEKVAHLIRSFARLGCQQLQLNTLNLETLKKAKESPDLYKNLIVRVWGWSGYFCELAPEYQDHIIMRQAHQY